MPDHLDPQVIHVVGWTLVHSLWQATLIGLGVFFAVRLLRQDRASWRYGVACTGLLAIVASAAVTAFLLSSQQNPVVPFDTSISWVESQLGWVCLAWVLGVTGLSLRLTGAWFLVYRLRRTAIPVHGDLQERVEAIKQRLGVSQPVKVFRSALVRVPMVVGWLKPAVLVPASLVTGIPTAELEALIAHELGHIRRYDYLVNGLQTVVETVFFYHPAVWWVSRQIRLEREHCCDDVALSLADKVTYTRALLELEEYKGAGLTLSYNGVRADGGHLVSRVRRLASANESSGSPVSKGLCGLAMAALLLTSVQMSDAGRSAMLDIADEIVPIEIAVRYGDVDVAAQTVLGLGSTVARPAPVVPAPVVALAPVAAPIEHTKEMAADKVVEPAPPVAERSDRIRRYTDRQTFLSVSSARSRSTRTTPGRFGLGLGGGLIQSSSLGPLSPNVELKAFYALNHMTRLEMAASFSMFLDGNLYAYIQPDGHQVEEMAHLEQQWQLSLGIRRRLSNDQLAGLYYGVSGGVMRLPIHRLIGDMDKLPEEYGNKTGVFMHPKVGYLTRANGRFSWDLSAGLSFSRANDIAFVQPTVSMGMNFWR